MNDEKHFLTKNLLTLFIIVLTVIEYLILNVGKGIKEAINAFVLANSLVKFFDEEYYRENST